MPLSGYFHGHGVEVMHDMKKKYGEKKGEEVFYATANKQKEHAKERTDKKPWHKLFKEKKHK